jgi:hypothetical protein
MFAPARPRTGGSQLGVSCALPASREYDAFGTIIPNSLTGTWPGRWGYQGQAWIEILH